MSGTGPDFAHLHALTDGRSLDDAARALVVTCREPRESPLRDRCLDVVLDAQVRSGEFHARRDVTGRWSGEPELDEGWGLALWGLGAVISCTDDVHRRSQALHAYERGAFKRSRSFRAMAYAALGAAEVVTRRPDNIASRRLLADAVRLIGPVGREEGWPWPEPQLTVANAVVPEVLIAAGTALSRPAIVGDGLLLLAWLLEHEPVVSLDDSEDLRAVEVAHLADACARAYAVTGEEQWSAGVQRAQAWFDDDARGLHVGERGVGATVARISTRQRSSWLALCLT